MDNRSIIYSDHQIFHGFSYILNAIALFGYDLLVSLVTAQTETPRICTDHYRNANRTSGFTVRKTTIGMDYCREFSDDFRTIDGDTIDADGCPLRTAVFAKRLMDV